jgi:hypothetical protein
MKKVFQYYCYSTSSADSCHCYYSPDFTGTNSTVANDYSFAIEETATCLLKSFIDPGVVVAGRGL